MAEKPNRKRPSDHTSDIPTPADPDAPCPSIPAGVKDFFAVLGVQADAGENEVHRAYNVFAGQVNREYGGAPPPAISRRLDEMAEAVNVLTRPELRRLYLAMIDSSGPPRRYRISGYVAGLCEYSDDLHYVQQCQNRGLKTEDLRPGTPGLSDPSVVCRWKIEVPRGRKWAGETRTDSYGTAFVDGVAYTSDQALKNHYDELSYAITDRGDFNGVPGNTGY